MISQTDNSSVDPYSKRNGQALIGILQQNVNRVTGPKTKLFEDGSVALKS